MPWEPEPRRDYTSAHRKRRRMDRSTIDTERVPLADIEGAWQRDQQGRRLVLITQ